MGVLIWSGVLWRRTNAAGAWASFAVMVGIWAVVGPPGMGLRHMLPHVGWLGVYADKSNLHWLLLSYLPAGVIALVVGSLLGRPLERRKLDGFYALLRTPVGEEARLVEAGVDVVYVGQAKGHPWEMKHHRAVNVIGFIVAFVLSLCFLGLLYLLSRIGA